VRLVALWGHKPRESEVVGFGRRTEAGSDSGAESKPEGGQAARQTAAPPDVKTAWRTNRVAGAPNQWGASVRGRTSRGNPTA